MVTSTHILGGVISNILRRETYNYNYLGDFASLQTRTQRLPLRHLRWDEKGREGTRRDEKGREGNGKEETNVVRARRIHLCPCGDGGVSV